MLVRHLLWTAVGLGRPLHLHTGFGDSDIRMHRVDPTHLTDWLHLTAGTIPVLLLHCWPNSDAYGVAEFHHLGALAFRRGLGGLLGERVAADEMALPDAPRIARWAGRDNARRVCGLPGGPRGQAPDDEAPDDG